MRDKIEYFRNCYQADTRSFSLTSILHPEKYLSGHFDDAELFQFEGRFRPLETIAGEAILRHLKTNSQEERLYGWLFALHTRQSKQLPKGRTKNLLLPLVLYEARLIRR